MRFSTIAVAGFAATAQATWHGEWKFPDGIKGPKDDGGKEVGPGDAPPDGYLPVYHPPHHDVVIDDCQDKDDDGWHWVHPGKDHHEDDYKWTTSTITATQVSTVIDCGDKECEGGGGKTKYTTVTVPETTTICPVPVAPEPTPEQPEEPYPEPPVEEPPIETYPVQPEPPVTEAPPPPPEETAPVEPEPPVEEPPVETQPGYEEPPAPSAPVEEPPVPSAPVEEPPVPSAPVEEPPVETQPGYEEPPAPSAPVEEPPVESEPVPVPPPTSIGTITRPAPSATEGLEPVPTAAAANVRVGGAVVAAAVAAAFL